MGRGRGYVGRCGCGCPLGIGVLRGGGGSTFRGEKGGRMSQSLASFNTIVNSVLKFT